MDKSYVLVALEDEKTRELGQVIASETARKILNLLTTKNATSTEIASELKINLSTISYNLQQLLKAGLIKINGTFYSGKGKTVNVYTLSKKIIMIVPQGVSLVRRKLKSIIPAILIGFFISVFIKIFYVSKLNYIFSAKDQAVEAVAGVLKETATQTPAFTSSTIWNVAKITTNYAVFFFIGALFGLVIYLVMEHLKEKRK